MAVALVVALGLPMLAVEIPQASAGGTSPSPSGNYVAAFWGPFHTGPKIESFALAAKLTNENDAAHDYYEVSVYFKQLDDDVLFDWGNFWAVLWEHGGAPPVELNWEPGFAEYGNDPVTFNLGLGAGGVSMSVGWTHQAGSEWDIKERPSFDDPSQWRGRMHHEFVNLDSRRYDWDTLTFTSTWKVNAGNAIGLSLGSQIGWSASHPADCWYPCHKDGSKCSPCIWVDVAPGSSPELCAQAEGVIKDVCTPMPLAHPDVFSPEEVDPLESEDLDALLSQATVCSPIAEPPEGADWSEACVGSGGWEETDCTGHWTRYGHDHDGQDGRPHNANTGTGHYDPDGEGGHWTDRDEYERVCYDDTEPRYCEGTDDYESGTWVFDPTPGEKRWQGGHWEETCVGASDGCVAWHSEGTYDSTRRRVEQSRDCDPRHACNALLEPVARLLDIGPSETPRCQTEE